MLTTPSGILPGTHPRLDEQGVQEPLYRVIIHNDDVTPMDFVVFILRSVFLLDSLNAFGVMYTAHFHGSAYVQTLPRGEAQRRVGMAHFTASLHKYPWHFTLKPE